MGDVPSATAILDRFLGWSELIQITGKSYHLDKSEKSSNSTEAPTGSDSSNTISSTSYSRMPIAASRSRCEPYSDVILAKLDQAFDCKWIQQDLISENGFQDEYWSVYRFVHQLGKNQPLPLPFRRVEVEPGWELQVDFGVGRPCKDHTGTMRKTHIFRAVLFP